MMTRKEYDHAHYVANKKRKAKQRKQRRLKTAEGWLNHIFDIKKKNTLDAGSNWDIGKLQWSRHWLDHDQFKVVWKKYSDSGFAYENTPILLLKVPRLGHTLQNYTVSTKELRSERITQSRNWGNCKPISFDEFVHALVEKTIATVVSKKWGVPCDSAEKIRAWCRGSVEFKSLFDKWVRSSFSANLKPSLGRKIKKVGFVVSNLVAVCYEELNTTSVKPFQVQMTELRDSIDKLQHDKASSPTEDNMVWSPVRKKYVKVPF